MQYITYLNGLIHEYPKNLIQSLNPIVYLWATIKVEKFLKKMINLINNTIFIYILYEYGTKICLIIVLISFQYHP